MTAFYDHGIRPGQWWMMKSGEILFVDALLDHHVLIVRLKPGPDGFDDLELAASDLHREGALMAPELLAAHIGKMSAELKALRGEL